MENVYNNGKEGNVDEDGKEVELHELRYSGAEVAGHLGVTNSRVTRFISSGKKPETEGIIYELCAFCTNIHFTYKAR